MRRRTLDRSQASTRARPGSLNGLRLLTREMVTKQDLRETLSHYATKADLHREFVTLLLGQTVAMAGVLGGAEAFFGS